ncbi:MAG: ribonuclease catalytic domain-containing protein, partial [Burkholderiales bacterium]
MTHLIISDGTEYKIATLLESHKNHYQVELCDTKLCKKIKSEHKLYEIALPSIYDFQHELAKKIPEIDSELLWELIDNPNDKHSIYDLANLYFGTKVSQLELTALLFHLAEQKIEVQNYMDGHFSLCTTEERQKRQAIALRQQEEQQQFNRYYQALINLQTPEFEVPIIKLLTKPDKHSPPYKALAQASKELGLSQLELCHKAGIIANLEQFFIQSFMQETFPKEINYTTTTNQNLIDIAPSQLQENLQLKVFSIDDSTTTEIDDAFSVQRTDSGWVIGIHIAAPALNSQLAEMAAENISTIYYPGHKLTMFPEEIIQKFSLWENSTVPVVSIYFTLDQEFTILNYSSRVEKVIIDKNLRIEELELLFNEENLLVDHGYPYESELKILYQFALKLEEKRGKPSVNNLIVDYNFSFEHSKVVIKPRLRGNPIDKLVSELMILANCTWGRMLTNAFIPAIYRVKQPNYPVRMTLTPDSHTGLNVDYYTWATSPLRRAADYMNQKQIISLVTEPKKHCPATDPALLEVIENFDAKYAKY